MLPLLASERERKAYERCWQRVRATWTLLRPLPIGEHPRRERRGELLQELLWLGQAASLSSLFRGRASVSIATFEKRLQAAVPSAGGCSVAAVRAHLQRAHLQRRRLGWPWWASLKRPWRQSCRRVGWLRVQARSLRALLAASPAPADGGPRKLWDCFDPRTPAHLVLNGLLFGFPLASTASLLLTELSRRRIRLSSQSLSHTGLTPNDVAEAVIGRQFDAALWAWLQPGRRWAASYSPPADWTVDEVSIAELDEAEPVARARGRAAVLTCTLVLVRTALRSSDPDGVG